MVRETRLAADDLIQPLFVKDDLNEPKEIETMPGQFQHSPESVIEAILDCESSGIPAVILFGIPAQKDAQGSEASHKNGVVQEAIRTASREVSDILLVADVCLCEYTDHGHCGLVENGEIVNDGTLDRLAETSVSLAEAGADVIAPSDMMDGRIGRIRSVLDENGFERIPIMSYAVKYHSSFYGPFRDAAESSPDFGDRRTYQMDPANRREALQEASLDVQEGADWLMVKPALPYLDVLRDVRDEFGLPTAAYCVSGEYGMIESAAADERLDRRESILELLTSIRRAGADVILTYWAREVAGWLDE